MNRPQLNWPPAPKRPNPLPQHYAHPSKVQRNFHLNTSPQDDLEQYNIALNTVDPNYDQSLADYMQSQIQDQIENPTDTVPDDISELSDIHFLDQ